MNEPMVRTPPAGRAAVLLAVAQSVTALADLPGLWRNLAGSLRDHLHVDYISFSLVGEDGSGQLGLLEPVGGSPAPVPADTPKQLPRGESPTVAIYESQEPIWLSLGEGRPGRFPSLEEALRRQGVQAAGFVPLTTPRRRLGAMAFSSYRPLREEAGDLDFLCQIGRLVALAVEGTLTRQELRRANESLTGERDRLRLLLEVGTAVSSRLDLPGLLKAVAASLHRMLGQERAVLWLPEADGARMRAAASEPAGTEAGEGAAALEAFRTGLTVSPSPGLLALPLRCGDAVAGVLGLHASPNAFTPQTVELLEQAARPVGVAVNNALAYRRIEQLTARLAQEKRYLEEEIRFEGRFDEIVGEGLALREVLRQAEVVAPTDTTVLITGETGTGKELIARAVHRLSSRRGRTFVKLNCAAIPTGLLESELFGHEKGAFTGAVERRIGRFELADGGTLFLDEVGDIPPELQPKLLRVLQEQEFERLGSAKTLRVNVRVVAATHRDLARMAAAGAFRQDLFYRLHVFPIHLPPLRQRRDDIPALVRHFVGAFSRRLGKVIDAVPASVLEALQGYDWPGNVRELEHLIERAVILTTGRQLALPPGALPAPLTGPAASGTLKDAERDMIRQALEQCGWVVGGRKGAAARLGLKRTTLLARMNKLGLRRPGVSTE